MLVATAGRGKMWTIVAEAPATGARRSGAATGAQTTQTRTTQTKRGEKTSDEGE